MQIISKVVTMPVDKIHSLETELNKQFGTILRWAIVDVSPEFVKISFTYKAISA